MVASFCRRFLHTVLSMTWLRGFGAIQSHGGDRASPWSLPHLNMTCAMDLNPSHRHRMGLNFLQVGLL